MPVDELELGRRVAASFDPAVARVRVVKGGGRKIVWYVEGSRGAFALKRMHYEVPRARFAIGLHRFAAQRGAPLPEPLSTLDGRPYVVRSGKVFAAYRWLPGARHPRLDDDGDLRQVVGALAAFHTAALGYRPPQGSRSLCRYDADRQRLSRLAAWLERMRRHFSPSTPAGATFLRLWRRARKYARQAAALARGSWYRQLLAAAAARGEFAHNDVGRANLLVAAGGAYVIDLDGAVGAASLNDLVSLIRKACRVRHPSQARATVEQALAWYDEVRPLGADGYRFVGVQLAFPWEFLRAGRKLRSRQERWSADQVNRAFELDRARRAAALDLLR